MKVFTRIPFHRYSGFAAAIAVFLVSSASSVATAAYNHPVMWTDMSEFSVEAALTLPYSSPANLYNPSFSDSVLNEVARDKENKINSKFKIPHEIRPAVTFWLKIYTRFTTQHIVLYDSRHPDVIYEALDFRRTAETAKSRLVYEVIVKNKLKKTIAAYKTAFASLARNSRPKNPSREQKLILKATRNLPHKHDFADLKKHMRSQTGQRDNIIKGLIAAETFFPKMELIFSKMNLPIELTRLSLVESSFTYSAISRVGATGVWQFMPDSGREFLMIDEDAKIDERLSPLKSTVAAGKLLKRNFRVLKNWALAITSYNHGTRSLRKIAASEDFKTIAPYFSFCSKRKGTIGWASRNYYPEFLAVLYAETYRDRLYGEVPKTLIRPIVYESPGNYPNPLAFALHRGINLQEFKLLNPDIRDLSRRFPPDLLVAVPGERDNVSLLFVEASRRRKAPSGKARPLLASGPRISTDQRR
ncbi:MAG: hypothetical protein A2Z97_05880 [Bdellovibrionales bacterium GWB1_52_6]|nr:MAG: hypothetical protein A2Z97_05880 [Bdellovibrionales bacterium GWB1_52_6]OFZ04404.1 MAG: hypothetical protein A2X97_07095 [Bdellovibrionales bacterium GWA1_52_35]